MMGYAYNEIHQGDCTTPCLEGTWGENCNQECPKYPNSITGCDPIDGKIKCMPGYVGEKVYTNK